MLTKYPNLFIIGAMKAGTSSLHEYLNQHPQIFMSRFKEPQYFAAHQTRWGQLWGQDNPFPESGIDWYLRLFTDVGDVKYAGESSVSYTAMPSMVDCEKRIHAFNPNARLIYLLRDPIERTISHYWHFVADGREDLDILTALQTREDYLSRSDYARQLRPYLKTFGAEQIFVPTLEELTNDPIATFRRLFTWLGVDADYPITIEQKFNVGPGGSPDAAWIRISRYAFQKSWRWCRYRQYMPSAVTKSLERVTYREVDRSAGSATLIDYLQPIFRQKVEDLSLLLGREFPCGARSVPMKA